MIVGRPRLRTGLITTAVLLVALTVNLSSLPSAAFAANPHVPASVTASSCPQCHDPHEAAVGENILKAVGTIEGAPDAVKFCYACHDGSSAVNVKTGMNNAAFDNVSGHSVEAAGGTGADLTDECANCHDPHADSTSRIRLPKETITVTLPDNSTVDRSVDGADNTWCFACHDAQHSWWVSADRGARSTAAYDTLIAKPSRNATGYPLAGTFPGETAYAGSAHAAIPAAGVTDWVMSSREATRVAGDCLWCHSAHRGDNEHDGLVASFSGSSSEDTTGGAHPGRYAQACFECHGNSTGEVYRPAGEFGDTYWQGTAGAPDIYSLVTADTERGGHRIKTSGALYEQGSPLPCYECHNPHGSKNGNTVMISDALGGNLDPRDPSVPANAADGASAAKVRAFCFSCHTTGDTGAGWDSDANNDGVHTDGVYTATLTDTAIGDSVVGISRTGSQPLQLLDMDGHRQGDFTQSCLDCHGDVHNPTGGVSSGGLACYGCHQEYRATMDANSTTTHAAYGHIVGVEGGASGDTATSYPTSSEPVYCLSCHVDHDEFYDGTSAYPTPSAANLRTGITGTVTGTDTDHEQGTSNGICVSCHGAPVGNTTYTVSGAGYAGKAHDYEVNDASKVGYGSSAFRANCVKCHTDPAGLDDPVRQDGLHKITPHFSRTESRIARALGADVVSGSASSEESLCLKCHDRTPTANPDPDGYGVLVTAEGMSDESQLIGALVSSANVSAHKVGLYAGEHSASETAIDGTNKHVECEDCHNPHEAGMVAHTVGGAAGNQVDQLTSPLSGAWGVDVQYPIPADPRTGWSANWTEPSIDTIISSVTQEYQVCFKCHSSYNGAYSEGLAPAGVNSTFSWGGADGTTDEWTNVALEFNPNNVSFHPVVGPTSNIPAAWSGWMISPWTNIGNQTMSCSDCHGDINAAASGPHGSAVDHVLKGYWPLDSQSRPYVLNGPNGYDGLLCARCHSLTGSAQPSAHQQGARHQVACYSCHLVVPHGGKLQGLMADRATMPGRYAVDGSYQSSSVMVNGYSGGGAKTNCDADGCSPKNGHPNTAAQDW